MRGSSLAEKASEEVRALHAFFVAWFRGANPSADFATCEAVLAPDFRMVTPDGGIHDRRAVIERLRAARGSAPSDFTIDIVQLCVVWKSDDAVLLEFVEQQYRDGRTTSRHSTGLFTHEPAAPRGVAWRHLHETWMLSAEEDTNQVRAGSPPRREA